MHVNPNDLAVIETFVAQFAARDDVYTEWTGDHWSCRHEYLTPEKVAHAFNGGPAVSGFPIAADGLTHIAAIDFDSDDGMELGQRLRAAMSRYGVTAYLEASRRGCHLWVLLDRRISAKAVRRALRGFLQDAMIDEDPKIELRPAFDEPKLSGTLRFPTMPHPKTGVRYPMLGSDDQPLPGKLSALLLAMDWSPAAAFEDRSMRYVPPASQLPADYLPPKMLREDGPVESVTALLFELFGLHSAPGRSVRCPFHDDRAPSLSISRDDERAWCKSPACWCHNDGNGRGPGEIRRHAAG